MRIPLYWSQGTSEEIGPDGKTVSLSRWRSSDDSAADAQQLAVAAAKESTPAATSHAATIVESRKCERISSTSGSQEGTILRESKPSNCISQRK